MITKLRYLLYNLRLVLEFTMRAMWIKATCADKIKQRHRLARNTHRIAKKFLTALNITFTVQHPERLSEMNYESYLAICNHASYTDIIILAAMADFVFITSEEMGKSPFLGNITRNGGCLYTNRKKHSTLPQEIDRFARTITQGFKVMLFPEGTSTNGDTVKQFRSSLFQTVYLAKCPVLPFCIRYRSLDGQPITQDNRDQIYWYGDMGFAPHIWKLLGTHIEAEVSILEPILDIENYNRRSLSDKLHGLIHDLYHSTSHEAPTSILS